MNKNRVANKNKMNKTENKKEVIKDDKPTTTAEVDVTTPTETEATESVLSADNPF